MIDELTTLMEAWSEPSRIDEHDGDSSDLARRWLREMDRSLCFIEGTWHDPTWVRGHWDWGPMPWPTTWGRLVSSKTIDCGALAAISTYIMRERGLRACSLQAILRYPDAAVRSWRVKWESAGLQPDWISGRYVYHEVTAVLEAHGIRIWDSTENRWYGPEDIDRHGYAELVALRLPRGFKLPPEDRALGTIALREAEWVAVR